MEEISGRSGQRGRGSPFVDGAKKSRGGAGASRGTDSEGASVDSGPGMGKGRVTKKAMKEAEVRASARNVAVEAEFCYDYLTPDSNFR